jgi:predicted short-subunit dehydrogenase-like oxidoreductase (DUF2520 family)
VLGAGRAGRCLAAALGDAGVPVVGLHGRRAVAGPLAVSAGELPPSLTTATVILVTVRDDQLPEALAQLLAAPLAPGAVVLHASGSRDPRPQLDALRAAGHPCGTFHPLVPMADPARASALLRGGWVGVDGDPGAVRVAEALADCLGAHVLTIPPSRDMYHLAAVMVSNFPTVLAALAAQLMQRAGVDAVAAGQAVRHLLSAAVANLGDAEPQAVLAGPVSRGDTGTVTRHLAALRGDPATLAVYVALSRAALPLAAAQGADSGQLRQIADLLDRSSSEVGPPIPDP